MARCKTGCQGRCDKENQQRGCGSPEKEVSDVMVKVESEGTEQIHEPNRKGQESDRVTRLVFSPTQFVSHTPQYACDCKEAYREDFSGASVQADDERNASDEPCQAENPQGAL